MNAQNNIEENYAQGFKKNQTKPYWLFKTYAPYVAF